MLELLANPKRAEREPWEMFFVGLLYAALSLLLVDLIFLHDPIFSKYSSILIVTFTVIFSIPFMYFIIKLEEEKELKVRKESVLIKEHGRALAALLYLFLGFIVAFAFFYIVMPQSVTAKNFGAQIEQYCMINSPKNFEVCISSYGLSGEASYSTFAITKSNFFAIFTNNLFVLIFVLIFSLAFGAGAIFILAWNASVIGAAIGIFTGATLRHLHVGIARYMIHGLPEIAAYFVAALAGGILSIAVIRHEFGKGQFWHVLRDSVDMLLLSIALLILAALLEVFIVPFFF